MRLSGAERNITSRIAARADWLGAAREREIERPREAGQAVWI
jgi:hypothetical protein